MNTLRNFAEVLFSTLVLITGAGLLALGLVLYCGTIFLLVCASYAAEGLSKRFPVVQDLFVKKDKKGT
jgi:hypothetical protein